MQQGLRNPKRRVSNIIFWVVTPLMLVFNWVDHMFTRHQRIWIAWAFFLAYILATVFYLLGRREEKKAKTLESQRF